MSEAGTADATLPAAVRALIGLPCHARAGDIAATEGAVRALAAAIADPEPMWWDAAACEAVAGESIAPPVMLSTWSRPELWQPQGAPRALALHHELKDLLGYPVAIVSAIDSAYHAPVRLGDRLASEQRLLSVSPEKRTRLGTGRFWRIEVRYTRPDGELAGTETFECFGYRREAG